MRAETKHITKFLFGTDRIQDITLEQLQGLVEECPSFPVAHYLVSCKMQQTHDERFLAETQKTALYFNNPFWLQWLLQGASLPETELVSSTVAAGVNWDQVPSAAEVFLKGQESRDLTPEEIFTSTPSAPLLEVFEEQRSEFLSNELLDSPTDQVPALEQTVIEIETISYTDKELESGQAEQPPTSFNFEGYSLIALSQSPQDESSITSFYTREISDVQPEGTNFSGSEQENLSHDDIDSSAIQHETDQATWQPPVASEQREPSNEPVELSLGEQMASELQASAEDALTAPETGDLSQVAAAAASWQQTPSKLDPLFDPFHTIDYFASQGIRFVQDDNPSDKFSKQLKSFTDWLKVMKRLPQKSTHAASEADEPSDADIQNFAAHSIEEKAIITEAMAAVLAKQGKLENAIELYHKLSLLNPAKSAYFAAKIEELKTI